ncbi:MAG: HDOD domain-containing protein [Spirochaetales bacterium]|nr:HDOD domain-containing protein [Spirochaetales bacterium]
MLNRKEAEQLLEEGRRSNEGPWIPHSQYVALAAEAIAKATKSLDPDRAYVLGLLHDIGKSDPTAQNRHPLLGYDFMIERGESEIAQISLTHPYALKDFHETIGYSSYSEKENLRIEQLLASFSYTDYDLLIQLCDGLAIPEGIVLLEKRLFDVHLRHGFNDYTLQRWKRLIEIKKHFEKLIGFSLYDLFPESVGLTFSHDF